MLLKKRPSNNEGGGGRGKRTSNASAPSTPGTQPLHNGTDPPTFLKPDPLPSMTWQEYYEADEILKVGLRTPRKPLDSLQQLKPIQCLLPNSCGQFQALI